MEGTSLVRMDGLDMADGGGFFLPSFFLCLASMSVWEYYAPGGATAPRHSRPRYHARRPAFSCPSSAARLFSWLGWESWAPRFGPRSRSAIRLCGRSLPLGLDRMRSHSRPQTRVLLQFDKSSD